MKHLLAGDAGAGDAFVIRFETLVYSSLTRLCGLPADCIDEAHQSVFAKLFEDDARRLRSWKGESSLSTWLIATAGRLGREYRDRELAWRESAEGGGEGSSRVSVRGEVPTPEGESVIRQMEKIIRLRLENLEEVCRRVIDMRFVRDLSFKETALAAGISVSEVSVRLHRCVEFLVQRMKREFPDLFDDRFNLDL